jgi:hypothetical protein
MTIRSIPAIHAGRSSAARGEDWFTRLRRVRQAIETRRRLAEMDR